MLLLGFLILESFKKFPLLVELVVQAAKIVISKSVGKNIKKGRLSYSLML